MIGSIRTLSGQMNAPRRPGLQYLSMASDQEGYLSLLTSYSEFGSQAVMQTALPSVHSSRK